MRWTCLSPVTPSSVMRASCTLVFGTPPRDTLIDSTRPTVEGTELIFSIFAGTFHYSRSFRRPDVRRALVLCAMLTVTAASSNAEAWGCDGHRAIAFLAERLLTTSQLNAVRSILQASPPDPLLERICPP